MPKRLQELTAIFRGERHAFENSADSRTIIADAKVTKGEGEGGTITIKGDSPEGELEYGQSYRFFGQWKAHPQYGDQFWFNSYVLTRPNGKRGTVRYLLRCEGIGLTTAEKIWAKFRSDSLEILRSDPARVSTNIKGLSGAVAANASIYLKEQIAIESTVVEIYDLIDGRGFPKSLPNSLIERYGTSASAEINNDPFILMSFGGVGYLLCDKLWLELGKDPTDIRRQSRALQHVVRKDRAGHTWIRLKTVFQEIHGLIAAQCKPEEALKSALDNGWVEVTEDRGEKYIAITSHAHAETAIAQRITEVDDESTNWPDALEIPGLTVHQRGELARACQGRIGVLTGSPGVGKTFTTAALIKEVAKNTSLENIAVLAPTGKAAVRITEALAQQGVNIRARTIHSHLEVMQAEGGQWSFRRSREFPLDQEWIFFDEGSMPDASIFAQGISACNRNSHILISGDIGQLPPVGHGAPLRDMLTCVPRGDLTEIWRNSGRIVKACKQIKETGSFTPSESFDLPSGENLLFTEDPTPGRQVASLERFIEDCSRSGNHDPKWSIQVLSLVNDDSPLSRNVLNKRLQEILNPNGTQRQPNPFRLGDKIMCVKNGKYKADPMLTSDELLDEYGKCYVANGEQAEVVDIQPRVTTAELQMPYRVVTIPHGKQDKEEEGEDKTGTGSSWCLAYAITTHKSQGSSWPFIAMMIDNHPKARQVASRNLFYTGISRAEKAVLCIGRHRHALQYCERDAIKVRKTFLRERIMKCRQAMEQATA